MNIILILTSHAGTSMVQIPIPTYSNANKLQSGTQRLTHSDPPELVQTTPSLLHPLSGATERV